MLFFSPPLPWQSQSGAGVNAVKRKKRVEKSENMTDLIAVARLQHIGPNTSLINTSWSARWGRAVGRIFRSIGGDSASPSRDKTRQDLAFQQRPCFTLHRSRFTQRLCLRKALMFKTSRARHRKTSIFIALELKNTYPWHHICCNMCTEHSWVRGRRGVQTSECRYDCR